MPGRTKDPGDLLTIEEAAELLRLNPGTLRHWLTAGRLPSYRVGRHRLLRRADIDAFVESCREVSTAGHPGPRSRKSGEKAEMASRADPGADLAAFLAQFPGAPGKATGVPSPDRPTKPGTA